LPPQPARLLALLAGRQGEVVTRDELREKIWGDTNVDFDTSLHFCVRQVRLALGDSASEPAYIENVPRRGYRLIPMVTRVGAEPVADPPRSRRPRIAWIAAAAFGAALVAAVAAGYSIILRTVTPAPIRIGIMPFQAPGQPPTGIAEAVLEQLMAAAGPAAEIVGPTTTAAYTGPDANMHRLAEEHDLEFIVNGRFINDAHSSRMLAELIRASDGAHVWVKSYQHVSDGHRIGQEVADSVQRLLLKGR
jgi:DNA-binding winged helix-turn-helix (wHTH) protein/TolB-like protein